MNIRFAEIDAPEKGQPFYACRKQFLSSLRFRKQAKVQPKAEERNTW